MATPHVAGVAAIIWDKPDRDGLDGPKLDAAVDDLGARARHVVRIRPGEPGKAAS